MTTVSHPVYLSPDGSREATVNHGTTDRLFVSRHRQFDPLTGDVVGHREVYGCAAGELESLVWSMPSLGTLDWQPHGNQMVAVGPMVALDPITDENAGDRARAYLERLRERRSA